ncbi:hypothetical protein CYLTODRAFT_395984 [Cylindrobasidium torrendii FP15055 ss-10]|uniref:Uncharacterized protein n=1 Tax=Cylindrobasidium torrendii FP15055 ss-10 TaxID=1314674 RepID=A0A0D7BCX4_9AGAR|nr:hypothetical protein CYLTODRAFT_395984 [Cylindrobasidium torrendii FP15055 ss-10]
MKSAYDTSRFSDHYHRCRRGKRKESASSWNHAKRAGTSATAFSAYFTRSGDAAGEPAPSCPSAKPLPCPGIGATNAANIITYLRRTSSRGGGAPSIHVLARELYPKKLFWRKLNRLEKKAVRDAQLHRQRWRNEHEEGRVFSTSCSKITTVLGEDNQRRACHACNDLLKMHAFCTALRKPQPLKENLKYTNKVFHSRILGGQYASVLGLSELIQEDAQGSPFLRFSVGALNGKFDNKKVFLGLVQAMVERVERDERGVGTQNFSYAPAFDEFVSILATHSPRALKFFHEHFQARTESSIRSERSKKPKMPPTICEDTFNRVKERLDTIEYTGPVALACDDTKLLSGLRLYWDSSQGAHYLVGGTNGPVLVPDPSMVPELMQDDAIPKGTKVRVWTLQVPLPKMVPIVVAAVAIGNNCTAQQLLPPLLEIVYGLLDHNIDIVSYTCDGAATEQDLQRRFVDKADRVEVITIPSPTPNHPNIDITIAFFKGHPIAILQDSKHLAKTFRNNLFSGARLLVFGNHTAHFFHLMKVVSHSASPLYQRDVFKTDRQDDNAALRTLSAALLDFLVTHQPNDLGVIVYLFMCGEIHDAFQNRAIGHEERVKMVLRTYYFFQMWAVFLKSSPIYSIASNIISYGALDIVHTLVTGFISLTIIHRDYISMTFPLLPWLHSSEPCEHVFGMSRQVIEDFTMADFLHMIPKLDVKLRQAALRSTQDTDAAARARASGYNHTYLNTHDLDLAKLSSFPSVERIREIAADAAAESDSIVSLLGIMPEDLRPGEASPVVRLPGVAAMLGGKQMCAGDEEGSSDESDAETDSDSDEGYGEKAELLDLLARAEDPEFRRQLHSREERVRAETLTHAAIALETDELIQLRASAELNEEEELESTAEDMRHLEAVERALEHIADVNVDTGATANYGVDQVVEWSLEVLVFERLRHQTREAEASVRTRTTGVSNKTSVVKESESQRRLIIKAFYEELRLSQDQGVTSGLGRQARWKENNQVDLYAPGARGSDAPALSNGNSANATKAATEVTRQALAKRRKLFSLKDVPALALLGEGRVSGVAAGAELSIGQFGFVYTALGVMLGEVIAMYSKTGGKSGKHAAVTQTSSLGAVSYISVQLFAPRTPRVFSKMPSCFTPYHCKGFQHLLPEEFLVKLISVPEEKELAKEVAISEWSLFKQLDAGHAKLTLAMAEFRKRSAKD